ncbi:MAG: hypothetical protein KGI25_09395 [Thaumarchaeota archaeon]|nr:hypothetical protein [Nitrososphaerota archaeon]
MAILRIPRGLIIALIGIAVLVIGSNIFDSSYDAVESAMLNKQYLMEDKMLSPGQYLNSTITWNHLADHSVLIVNASPTSSLVNLQVDEPGGGTFGKESKNGYVYHIIGKSTQNQANYYYKVSNQGSEPATINVVLGEDPYLSGKCSADNEVLCYAIPAVSGLVIAGMLALIIGSAIAVNDFRKKRKPQPSQA